MSSHDAHLGIRDKIKIYAMPKAICNRPFYFTRKIGFGLSTFYTHFHKWLTYNIVTAAVPGPLSLDLPCCVRMLYIINMAFFVL